MTLNKQPDPPASGREPQPWAKATMWMVIVFLLVAGGLYIFNSIRDLPGAVLDRTGSAIEKARSALLEVVTAFSQKTVTTSFISYASSVSGSQAMLSSWSWLRWPNWCGEKA